MSIRASVAVDIIISESAVVHNIIGMIHPQSIFKTGAAKMQAMVSEIVILLLRLGAAKKPVRITTGEIAEELGFSQQTASRLLIGLEKGKMIERKDGQIRLLPPAISQAMALKRTLDAALVEKGKLTFRGIVADGKREGAYFLSIPEYANAIKRQFGFQPFPGTLNIRIAAEEIEKRLMLRSRHAYVKKGFVWKDKKLGGVTMYAAMLNGMQKGALVFPDKSTHGLDILEFVAEPNLREKFNLKTGDLVVCEVI
jgi:riboflavin kinase